ncbi:hypothetical protein PIB30_053569 [Stylosanthes scabra]|uniref:Uncharacterized protein n=1 Tax=Stylosanthes scabra TaxID=79078 RepID=A0ABU6RIW1_9FABA|nr:hypothetical protein [Stylosanthes scabra]
MKAKNADIVSDPIRSKLCRSDRENGHIRSDSIRAQPYKQVKKVYYRYPIEEDGGDSGSSGVGVNTKSSGGAGTNIRRWMVNLNMPHDGSFEDSNPGLDVPTGGILEEEIESHERSLVGDSMAHPYRINPTLSDDEEVEDEVMLEDAEAVEDEEMHEEVSEETNFFIHGHRH